MNRIEEAELRKDEALERGLRSWYVFCSTLIVLCVLMFEALYFLLL